MLEQAFVAVDNKLHDLKGFDCGKAPMNDFLKRFAVKHGKLGLSKTFVLPEVSEAAKKPVAAYYTLAMSSATRADIPSAQSLPSYPVPVVMLGRLAIAIQHQKSGLGSKVLVYALRQTVQLTKAGLPAYGLILDVLDEQALAFYKRFDMFREFTNTPMRLFVPMKTLEKI